MKLEELMNECIELFPDCRWQINYSFQKDIGHEIVPYCVVQFGKFIEITDEYYDFENCNYDYNSHEEFGTLFLTADKTHFISAGLEDLNDYEVECCRFAYETDIYDLVKTIHDEIMKWAAKYEH